MILYSTLSKLRRRSAADDDVRTLTTRFYRLFPIFHKAYNPATLSHSTCSYLGIIIYAVAPCERGAQETFKEHL